MKISIQVLRAKAITTLEARYTSEESAQIADMLLWAETADIKPMGIAKLTGSEPIQNMKAEHEVRVERDTKLSRLINAGGNAAPLVCLQAVDVAIQKAKEHGIAIVGVHNTHSSNLTQAYYVERMAHEDLIGIAMAGAPASAAPFDSIDPLFGTNPIGFGFPTNNDPLVFDMTTAAMTWSGLVLAKARGDNLPDGIAIDIAGNPTIDPTEAMEGATLMFDKGYKGSGLSLVIEMLTGPLLKAAYCDTDLEAEYGSFFIAIDPNLLVDTAEFKAHSSDLIAKIKASRTKDGVSEIRLPGERAAAVRKATEESGMVEVDDTILGELGYI
jgi:L-2-hydroxycarboxylate dehydrogenase (NAD+)